MLTRHNISSLSSLPLPRSSHQDRRTSQTADTRVQSIKVATIDHTYSVMIKFLIKPAAKTRKASVCDVVRGVLATDESPASVTHSEKSVGGTNRISIHSWIWNVPNRQGLCEFETCVYVYISGNLTTNTCCQS